jgi:putative membrane protein insertion efficiency factor
MATISQTMAKGVIALISVYQYCISPLLGHHCRFSPACSLYAKTAITKFGLGKGSLLAVKRLSRCHPFSAGGVDPI